MKSAPLTVSDLPTGYTAGTVSDDGESETDAGNDECADKFEALVDNDGAEAAKAEAAFEGGGLGSVLEQGLAGYEDEEDLRDMFDEVVEVLSDCQSFTSVGEDGAKIDFTLGAPSFPKLGDDTVALAVTGQTPEFDISLNIAIVRLGRNVMSISQGGLTTDAAVLEQVSRQGLDKLAAVAG